MAQTKVTPCVCADIDEQNHKMDIEIELKVTDTGFHIDAQKGDLLYTGSYTFCCPVVPDKTEAHYENGLLNIKVPLKEPFEGAVKVEVK